MGFFTKKKSDFTSSQRLMSQVAAKIDGTPKQIGLPKQREGLGNLISEYGADEVGKFKHAVVAVGNPMTEDEMDNAMLTADKGVKERPAKKAVEHDMILAGAVTQISLGHLIKERYKKYKYVGVVQMIMIFNSSTSFAGKYWEAHVEIVDDRLGDQTAIRGHEMDTNISLRIIMGIDFAIYEEDLYRMYIRVRSGIKREDMRWGSLKIVPTVTFFSGYRILPYIDTWFKPVFSHDHLKERVRDPAFTSSAAVQEDLNALKTLYEDGKIRDESKPDDSGATRECYEGTQFEKRGIDKSRKNKAAIANYMARMEEERKVIPVGDDDDISSEARMKAFVEEDEDGAGPSSSPRDSVLSPPPTYREKRKSVGFSVDDKKGKNRDVHGDDNASVVSGGSKASRIPRWSAKGPLPVTSEDD
jgi:hypothetical protein